MRPVVRLFVALWNGRPGAPFADYRLADVRTILRPTAGDQYPLVHPEFCFYATLTGGRGPHTFAIRQVFGVGPVGRVVWQSRPVTHDLGTDPLAVRGLTMRIKGLEFRDPGQYEFVLVCDGAELGILFLEARV